jgi:hypothetical protein
MVPSCDDEIIEAKAFGIKAVILAAVLAPFVLMLLHFLAATLHVEFAIVKEGELLLACIAIFGMVGAWAFKRA